MSSTPLGFGLPRRLSVQATPTSIVVVRRPLDRVLAFTRRTIDDVVNDPIVKREVLGYYKLQCEVKRTCERVDLERWWAGKGPPPRGQG